MPCYWNTRFQALLFWPLILIGCAHMQQEVDVSPLIAVSPVESEPKGSLYLTVSDNRESELVGYRGDLFGRAAEIISNDDLAPILLEQLKPAFVTQGFQVLSSRRNGACELEVELRHLLYRSHSTLAGFVIETSASLRGAAYKGGERYEEIYSARDERPRKIVPDAAENTTMINGILGRVLTELATDEALQDFLAKRCG